MTSNLDVDPICQIKLSYSEIDDANLKEIGNIMDIKTVANLKNCECFMGFLFFSY